MDLLTSVAIMGSTLLLVLVITVLLLGLWLPENDGDTPLLDQMLRRQGDRVAARALLRRDYPAALLRCDSCSQGVQCRAWLASGAREGYQTFCPNRAFIARMKQVV